MTRPVEVCRSRCTRLFSTKDTATKGSDSGDHDDFDDHDHDDHNHHDLVQCGWGSGQPLREHDYHDDDR